LYVLKIETLISFSQAQIIRNFSGLSQDYHVEVSNIIMLELIKIEQFDQLGTF